MMYFEFTSYVQKITTSQKDKFRSVDPLQKNMALDSIADIMLLQKSQGTNLFTKERERERERERKGKQHEHLTTDICSLNKSITRFPVN